MSEQTDVLPGGAFGALAAAPGSPLGAAKPAGRLPLAALAAALAAHAALLGALAGSTDDGLAGGGGHQLDAISVTLVNSPVLEARETSILQPPIAAAAAAIEATEGAADSAAAPEREKAEAAEDKEAVPEPAQAGAVVMVPPKEKPEERQEASSAAPAGSVAARGEEPASTTPQSAPAGASPGAVREYARYVSQALARSKPKGLGALGTVRIRLVVAQDGGLASVEVARSSGNTRLDRIAVAAVQSTTLPRPPPGMSPSDLTYEVPYHFR
jgi:protein TonB